VIDLAAYVYHNASLFEVNGPTSPGSPPSAPRCVSSSLRAFVPLSLRTFPSNGSFGTLRLSAAWASRRI